MCTTSGSGKPANRWSAGMAAGPAGARYLAQTAAASHLHSGRTLGLAQSVAGIWARIADAGRRYDGGLTAELRVALDALAGLDPDTALVAEVSRQRAQS